MVERVRRKDRVVLVAPQNEDTMLLAGLFATAGYALTTAFDADAALAICAKALPDAAIVDLDTPALEPLALVQRLRSLAGGQALRLVAVTSRRAEVTSAQLVAAGVDIEVGRPATVTKLIDALSVGTR